MGYIRHNTIVVTSFDANQIKRAHDKAVEIFTPGIVSGLVASPRNGYVSFFVAPDGSKEGWDESDKGDDARKQFVSWLDTQRYDDLSTILDWVQVQFGDDENVTKIVRDSDEFLRREDDNSLC